MILPCRAINFVRKNLNFAHTCFIHMRTRNVVSTSNEELFKLGWLLVFLNFVFFFPYSFVLTVEVFPYTLINRKQNSGDLQISKADAKMFFQ